MRLRALVLAGLLLAAAAAASEQRLANATAAEVRFVDAAPPGPSVAVRLAEIRRRIQSAVIYPPLARHRRLQGETLVRFEIEPDGNGSRVTLDHAGFPEDQAEHLAEGWGANYWTPMQAALASS